MFGYEFSKREKTLMLCLALVVVGLLWYRFVFVSTEDQIARLNSELSIAQTELEVAQTKTEQMKNMKSDVDAYKAKGTSKIILPDYDNTTQLMASLNSVLDKTHNYTLDFDDVDTTAKVVQRGVTISFSCGSVKTARKIMKQLERNTFACSIDSVSIISNESSANKAASSVTAGSSGVSVNLHAVFYETNKGD